MSADLFHHAYPQRFMHLSCWISHSQKYLFYIFCQAIMSLRERERIMNAPLFDHNKVQQTTGRVDNEKTNLGRSDRQLSLSAATKLLEWIEKVSKTKDGWRALPLKFEANQQNQSINYSECIKHNTWDYFIESNHPWPRFPSPLDL